MDADQPQSPESMPYVELQSPAAGNASGAPRSRPVPFPPDTDTPWSDTLREGTENGAGARSAPNAVAPGTGTSSPPALGTTEQLWSYTRLKRGCLSALGVLVPPISLWLRGMLKHLREPARMEHGYVMILPGIEGQSLLNHSLAMGLYDAGYPGAIEIDDWTTGSTLMFGYHLRNLRRNMRQAQRIAEKIRRYQAQYPGRPVHLIGHSGGGGILLLTLGLLKPGERVTTGVLLAPAVSPQFNLTTALSRVERGLWHFASRLDLFFLVLGTCLLGTIDGMHTVSAGACGFRLPDGLSESDRQLYRDRLHEHHYDAKMARSFHFAGHFGCTNRLFAADWLAPIVVSNGIPDLPTARRMIACSGEA